MRRSPITYRIGRSSKADIVFGNVSVSRLHAELVRGRDGTWYLTDRASTGGTFVWNAGKWDSIKQGFIHLGDRIKFGEYECRVEDLLNRIPHGGDDANETQDEGPGTGTLVHDDRPQGPVQRDPLTGDVVSAKNE